MPASDRKYLLVAKRLLILTSLRVVVPSFCCSSTMDDRWYSVPRRPLIAVSPVAPPPSVPLPTANPDDAIFAAADILEKNKSFSSFTKLLVVVRKFATNLCDLV
jgi:hypothetical protein